MKRLINKIACLFKGHDTERGLTVTNQAMYSHRCKKCGVTFGMPIYFKGIKSCEEKEDEIRQYFKRVNNQHDE